MHSKGHQFNEVQEQIHEFSRLGLMVGQNKAYSQLVKNVKVDQSVGYETSKT